MEKVIIKYQVAYGSYRAGLEKLVKHYLERGWELQGGVSVSSTADCEAWAQAMIKKELTHED